MKCVENFNVDDRIIYDGRYKATVVLAVRGHGVMNYDGYLLAKIDRPFIGWSSFVSSLFPKSMTPSDEFNNMQWIHPRYCELIGIDDGYEVDA